MSIAMKIPVHGIFNYKIFFLFYSFFVMDLLGVIPKYSLYLDIVFTTDYYSIFYR